MANKKTGKNVAGMAVLTDIRSLLSTNREANTTIPPGKKAETAPAGVTDAGVQELKQYQETIQRQQAQMARLETEKKELSEKLSSLQLNSDQPPQHNAYSIMEINDLEARKDELTRALSQVEGLLQLKIKDLVRRISRVYEEAGDFDAGRDFRRISNQMEAAENFGEFIRALLRE